MMNRRPLIQTLLGAAAYLMIPKVVEAIKPPVMSIDQIIKASYKEVIKDLRAGRPWVSDELNQAEADGRLRRAALGQVVEIGGQPGVMYEVQALNIPHCWRPEDEIKNPTEEQRIAFAAGLIRQGLFSHDILLARTLDDHDLVVSKMYRYQVGNSYKTNNGAYTVFNLYTAYAKLPKGSLA
jgi:hypothetical protein